MITIAAQIEGIASRKDKTIKLTLGTQEMTPNDAAHLFNLNQKLCYVALKEEHFTQEEETLIADLKTDFDNIKSPSQRFRAILFVNFTQRPDGYKDFQSYYLAKMDALCEHFKNKLD
jgi:hypothetical protein